MATPDPRDLMHMLRQSAARVRRDWPNGDAYGRGYAHGLLRAANEIGFELDDEVTLEATNACTCREQGTCTACELLALTYDLPALRRLADERCACEQAQRCPACRVVAALDTLPVRQRRTA